MRYTAALSLIVSVLITLECSRNPLMTAGSSVTGNAKVSGLLSKKDGMPASHTKVMLVSIDFDPLNKTLQSKVESVFVDTTDGDGKYVFAGIPRDTYSIEATGIADGEKLLIGNIKVDTDSVRVGIGVMQKTGAIKIMLPAGIDLVNGYVYIPGTDRYALIDNRSDFVVLDSVPAAVSTGVTVNYSVKSDPAALKVMAENITVAPESTVTMEYCAWLHAEKAYFNTTESGANISGNVVNFPVLLRLTEMNFDFSQAKPNGDDVRFAASNNAPLPYEIERWDAVNKQAEIWVKIDTIWGNSDARYMVFYWGNANAASAGNGAAVFDTSSGFQGVWHLAQTAAADATPNHFNGTSYNLPASSVVPGYIGMARQFNGLSSYIVMPGTALSALDFPKNAAYAVSAWVSADTLNGRYRIIASKGNKQYNLQIKNTDEWEFAEFRDTPSDSVGWEETTAPAEMDAWTYVTGVRSGAMQYLYVNGSCVDSSLVLYPLKASDTLRQRDQTNDFTIGKLPGLQSYFFNGKIDEVRVSNKGLGADWIHLCYMNQRTDDRLIVLK